MIWPVICGEQFQPCKMLEEIKNIDPSKLNDIQGLRAALTLLVNAVERLVQENKELKEENQGLRDENNRLKGGNPRPTFKNKAYKDISSKGKERGGAPAQSRKENDQRPPVDIDQEITVDIAAADLPADAVFKGYACYEQQDITIHRNNKKFLLAIYYSPAQKRTLQAPIPPGETPGHFGAGVKSLVNILHHYGNVTHSCLQGLLVGFGIHISTGSISNLLQESYHWAVEEQTQILQAGLQQPTPKQMDSTGNVQRGVNKVTHIITGPFFSVFYTLDSKSRLDLLRALQGHPKEDIQLMWHQDMEATFEACSISRADSRAVMAILKRHGAPQLSLGDFHALLQKGAPAVCEKKRIVSMMTEAMALYYFRWQDAFPCPEVLLSDDAPEYNKRAPYHALCWIHDARYYNKLAPSIQLNSEKLEAFKGRYWDFYQKLLDYKEMSASRRSKEKKKIAAAFDRLFGESTCYGALDFCMERTRKNKQELLRVLDFPDLPLHNNAAELAARKIVRKRDVSLHTWSDWGTRLRDAFLSIIETARKLEVPVYNYINDRLTRQMTMPSLAQLIIAQAP